MQKWTMLLGLFFFSFNLTAQEIHFSDQTIIYLVRHAEKEGGVDPPLTQAGQQRAGMLGQVLRGKNVSKIYVTKYRRSVMTGDSLRLHEQIDTVHYLADTTGEDLIRKIKQSDGAGKTVLVIGHSNTILPIIKALGIQNYTTQIRDDEFDKLFQITFKKGKSQLKVEKYGARSGISATMQPQHNPVQ